MNDTLRSPRGVDCINGELKNKAAKLTKTKRCWLNGSRLYMKAEGIKEMENLGLIRNTLHTIQRSLMSGDERIIKC